MDKSGKNLNRKTIININMTEKATEKQQLRFKIVVDRDSCTSCGSCEDVCPDLFELDEGGIVHIIGSERIDNKDVFETEDEKCGVDAAESCPVMIIHVYENGEEIL